MLLGGLGLLLIGMSLMTEGLKMAAGSALRDILSVWTSNRTRGLLSGFLITGLVQSSSAVTVATIGFANAGLLSLQQAVWVVFGSNVGTTMTGWIVALIGFKLNVEGFALPMIGIGVILKISGERSRRAAFGQALVGFGLLFLGIGILKETFEAFGEHLNLPKLEGPAFVTTGVYVLVGVLLTTVMQSSSAALVVALSAAEGGMIPLQAAAAVVIGANLGTTTTAMIAVLGATPTAKRVAISHVIFNVLTASVAMFILSPMLFIVNWVREAFALPAAPATTLALFHTVFNVLGILLIWPLADRMVSMLSRRFQTQGEVESQPKFLDRTSLGLPFIAGEALVKEIGRINDLAGKSVLTAMSVEGAATDPLDDDAQTARGLTNAVGNYSVELNRTELPQVMSELLPSLLRSAQQFTNVIDLARQTVEAQGQIGTIEDERLEAPLQAFRQRIARLAESVNVAHHEFDQTRVEAAVAELDQDYEAVKQSALREGVSGRISVIRMDALLRYISLARSAAKEMVKATRRLVAARAGLSSGSSRVAVPGNLTTASDMGMDTE